MDGTAMATTPIIIMATIIAVAAIGAMAAGSL
jgi:hypothetical protein